MRVTRSVWALVAVLAAGLAVTGCAKGKNKAHGDAAEPLDAFCGPTSTTCDSDGDGVPNAMDQCPNTPMGQPVNSVGCADSQLMPMLNNVFPPYMLAWSMGGDLGRAGGLNWGYSGIMRGDLFHIWWVICDDPMFPCGLSLNGPIDAPGEAWTYDATGTNLAGGVLVATNTTSITLASGSSVPLNGRLTVTITDGSNAPIPFATVAAMGIPARMGQYGAEIKGSAFNVNAIAEVEDSTMVWTPYLDYYDGAHTTMGSMNANVSFGGSFYNK